MPFVEATPMQGDQIGPSFAHWVAVYLEQFFLFTEVAHILVLLLSTVKVVPYF
jgi:hypothetical protein